MQGAVVMIAEQRFDEIIIVEKSGFIGLSHFIVFLCSTRFATPWAIYLYGGHAFFSRKRMSLPPRVMVIAAHAMSLATGKQVLAGKREKAH